MGNELKRTNLKIVSDFSDFYDCLSDELGTVQFIRNKSSMPSKVEGINILRDMGIQTINPMAVSSIISDKVIVYTNVNKHDGTGRAVMKSGEAKLMYPNYLGCKYYAESDNMLIKMLQVGSRRFKIIFKNEIMQSIEETASGYNMSLALPIYSIDYISTNDGLLAITLNTVENLSLYGIENIMSKEDVVKEIYDALIKYNKA